MGRVPLAPPIRFGTVAFPPLGCDTESETSSGEPARVTTFSECLYRGAYPKQRNLPYLETLHLRTIVSLTPKPIDNDEAIAAWAQQQNGGTGVRLVHVRTEKPQEETGGLTREGAARAILELLNRENLPLYVHCLDGVEATSTLVACLRKIQGWTDASIRDELARGSHLAAKRLSGAPAEVPKHLAHFVDHYGEPDGVLLPQRDRIPAWLWPSSGLPLQDAWLSESATVQHPSLRIHFERSEHYIASQRARFGAVWAAFAWPRSRTPSSLSMSDMSEAPPYESSDERNSSRRPSHTSTLRHVSESEPASRDDTELLPIADKPAVLAPPGDEQDLRTPRARPVMDVDEIPPLTPSEHGRVRASGHSDPAVLPPTSYLADTERTPLVVAKDQMRERSLDVQDANEEAIPPFDIDHEEDDEMDQDEDGDEDGDEDDDEDEDDEDDDPSQVLDALDLEGY